MTVSAVTAANSSLTTASAPQNTGAAQFAQAMSNPPTPGIGLVFAGGGPLQNELAPPAKGNWQLIRQLRFFHR
jgi:hypothetical protein